MKPQKTCLMLMMTAIAAMGPGCQAVSPPLPSPSPPVTSFSPPTVIDKIDLLLMLDNSRSMADKQAILADAVPNLVRGLVLPKCLDNKGVPAAVQPTSPLAACPAGTKHEFPPVLDFHIGIVTSSLGGHGSDACPVIGDNSCGSGTNPSNNDAAHLISRGVDCGGTLIPTYQDMGFLAWDPGQKLMPPGEEQLGDTMSPGLIKSLHDMVVGVGQIGCGYESQMESWYRFLVDPDPYQTIAVVNGVATPMGTDSALLQQRAEFLRPDSLLAIIALTDENDASFKEYGPFWRGAQQRDPQNPKTTYHLPRARQECAKDPNDPCCKPCDQAPGSCPADPICASSPTLNDFEDNINLRAFDNKRRFGIDFLYPIDRYTQALTSVTVPNRQGDLVANPIFSKARDPSLVFFAGIVGVPWQLIARDASDLTKGFQSEKELDAKDANGDSTWDKILGDPIKNAPPKDAHMIESIPPRAGLPPPSSPPDADPMNGHERSIPKQDDLQYACVFTLPATRDCSDPKNVSCDCGDPMNDNPLCDPANPIIQDRAKGYPGLRELAVVRSLGDQGIAASICPKQLDDATVDDYGYRPAIGAIIDRLKTRLKVALDGQCLPNQLSPDKDGQVACLVLEARNSGGKCACDAAEARRSVQPAHKALIDEANQSPLAATAGWDCFCEIVQAGDATANSSPEELAACQNDSSMTPVIMGGPDSGKTANGWCYVDATTTPPTGNPDLASACPASEKRLLRFVGAGQPSPDASSFVHCAVQ